MTDHASHHPTRRTVARPSLGPGLAAGALLLALAACETGPAAEPAVATAEPAPAAGAPAAPGPGATVVAGEPVVEERLSTVDCRTPSEGRVYFGVGDAVFAVPGDAVRTVIPPDVDATTPAAEIVAQLRARTAAGAGCPEKPLDAGLLAVAAPAGAPLLGQELALFRSPAGTIATPYGNLTRTMLGSPAKCQPADGGLLACPAVETDGAQQTQSVYFVSTDAGLSLAFGGPLAARCVVVEGRIRGCEIVDELPGGVGVRAPLTAVPQSGAMLADAHGAAIAHIRSLRR